MDIFSAHDFVKPGSNVLPKILPFWCKSGGGSICLLGVNWCKSMGVIYSEGVKWCKSWVAMGGLLRNYAPWLKVPCKSGLQWAAMGGLFRNYPPPDWNCHVRVGCNGLQWEDFSWITPPPPDWNCHVRVGCNGLQWEDFSGITPWLKLSCKSGLQWAAMGGLLRNYAPWLKLPCKSGLQWAAMGGLFRNYPLTEIAM